MSILADLFLFSFLFTVIFLLIIFSIIIFFYKIGAPYLEQDNLQRLTGPTHKYTKYLVNRRIKFVLHYHKEDFNKPTINLEVYLANIKTKEFLLVNNIEKLNQFKLYKFIYLPWMKQINSFLKEDFNSHREKQNNIKKYLLEEEKIRRNQINQNKKFFKNFYKKNNDLN